MSEGVKTESIYKLSCTTFGPILGNKQFRKVLEYCFRKRKRSANPSFEKDTINATFVGIRNGANMKQFLRRNFGVGVSRKSGVLETAEVTLTVSRKRIPCG